MPLKKIEVTSQRKPDVTHSKNPISQRELSEKEKHQNKSKSNSKVSNKPVFIYNPSIVIQQETQDPRRSNLYIEGLPPLPELGCDEETVRKEVNKLMDVKI